MADMTREYKLENIIVDIADGSLRSWYDIQAATGLSEERCREMEKEIDMVFAKRLVRFSLGV